MDNSKPQLNDIPITQNVEAQIELLRARRELYRKAKLLLGLQLCLVIGFPILGTIAVLIRPEMKAFLAAISIIIAVLDTSVLERVQKNIRRLAAKAAEQFDCTTLLLEWDSFVVGDKPGPEAISAASERHLSGANDPTLLDWYPPRVGTAPLHLARIICQRTNLWYDAKLRWQYGYSALAIVVVLNICFFLVGIVNQTTLESFVLSFLAPAAPVTIWGIREYFRQKDTAEAIDRLRLQAEKFWERALQGHCSVEECAAESRQFQNAIFERRNSSPIIFDWIYWTQRTSLEKQMHQGAEHFLNQI